MVNNGGNMDPKSNNTSLIEAQAKAKAESLNTQAKIQGNAAKKQIHVVEQKQEYTTSLDGTLIKDTC